MITRKRVARIQLLAYLLHASSKDDFVSPLYLFNATVLPWENFERGKSWFTPKLQIFQVV